MNKVEFVEIYHGKFGNGSHGRNSSTGVCKEVMSVCQCSPEKKSAKVEYFGAVVWISLRMLFHTLILTQVGNSDRRNQDKINPKNTQNTCNFSLFSLPYVI